MNMIRKGLQVVEKGDIMSNTGAIRCEVNHG